MKNICHIVGTRPNFVKAAPVIQALKDQFPDQKVIHTGQHYDTLLSESLMKQLNFPKPNLEFHLQSKTSTEKIGEIIQNLAKAFAKLSIDFAFIYGDVYSSLAAAITAANLNIPFAHVEAGLRSFDLNMPEERNRILIDRLANIHFTTEESAGKNLTKENISLDQCFFVGNTMIDSLKQFLSVAKTLNYYKKFNLEQNNYAVLTLHRPSNVDILQALLKKLKVLDQIAQKYPMIFPVHPRIAKTFNQHSNFKHIQFIPPLPYIEFISLLLNAKFVITDSGGVQEEASFLRLPCYTIRPNTERPITISMGTNILVPDINKLPSIIEHSLYSFPEIEIPLWDGKAAERIRHIFIEKIKY